jgi:hypothetical protein
MSDIAFYLQHLSEKDHTLVASGGDMVLLDSASPLRTKATAPGNIPNLDAGPLGGDIQIAGPGRLQVIAGGNLDLGIDTADGNTSDGTRVGITSIGKARNPYLSQSGAALMAAAGLSSLDPQEIALKLDSETLQTFFETLRDAGRNHSKNGGYTAGFEAIDSLFAHSGTGDIFARSRDIRTKSGGDISLLAPNGALSLADTALQASASPPGIMTEDGGGISILTSGNVDIGIGRIFTLKGGDILIWSSEGDIAAGSSAKTVKSAPPTRVVFDPQTASVETDLAGLATGGGIGVLATVGDVKPGDVDLIAPSGTVDAGDAGIRSSGNLNIAATKVLNADNISTAGASVGVPVAPVVSAPNVGGLVSGSSASAAAASAAQNVAKPNTQPPSENEKPSLITVEILGYGGGEGDSDEG